MEWVVKAEAYPGTRPVQILNHVVRKEIPNTQLCLWRRGLGPHIKCPHSKVPFNLILNSLTLVVKKINHVKVYLVHKKTKRVVLYTRASTSRVSIFQL